jgi:hypothetical protein
MSRSGKSEAVDRSAQQPCHEHEDDYSDDNVYDDDNWERIEDPKMRRQIQNRLAQRKFRKLISYHFPFSSASITIQTLSNALRHTEIDTFVRVYICELVFLSNWLALPPSLAFTLFAT